jgi:hypothetical protein
MTMTMPHPDPCPEEVQNLQSISFEDLGEPVMTHDDIIKEMEERAKKESEDTVSINNSKYVERAYIQSEMFKTRNVV